MKRAWNAALVGMVAVACMPTAAQATFHIVVVDEVFAGVPQAPQAQYVMLRTQLPVQTAVFGQPITVNSAQGQALPPFAVFCTQPHSACSLPTVSPACQAGGCPQPFENSANDRHILIATPSAQDLFCVTADLVAGGSIPPTAGRVCWGDCGTRSDCPEGPVDCVAYGGYSGDNQPFGSPAGAPAPGQALVADPARQGQYSPSISSAAVCVGGMHANASCSIAHDCADDLGRPGMDGSCVTCPGTSCRSLLDNLAGFSVGMPHPQNFHDDAGQLTGTPGDADGSGAVQVDGEVRVLFRAERRCELPAPQRGADANFDTRVSAADVVATVQLAASAGGSGGLAARSL